jgi:hypothetical protein
MTPQEIAASVAAAKVAEGFIAGFVPAEAQVGMVRSIGEAADAADSQTAGGRYAAGKAGFLAAIEKSGNAGRLGDDMVTGITMAVLGAVAAIRPSGRTCR